MQQNTLTLVKCLSKNRQQVSKHCTKTQNYNSQSFSLILKSDKELEQHHHHHNDDDFPHHDNVVCMYVCTFEWKCLRHIKHLQCLHIQHLPHIKLVCWAATFSFKMLLQKVCW